MSKIIILYSGLSINCAPRVENLAKELEFQNRNVSIGGIVKNNDIRMDIDSSYIEVFKGDSSFMKVISVFIAFIKLTLKLILSRKEFYTLYAMNPISGMVAYVVYKITGLPYIYETHEIFIGTKHNFFTGKWRIFWFFIESAIARSSKKFILTDQFRMKFMRRLYEIEQGKCDFIYNAPFNEVYNKKDLRDKYNINNDDFIISYCGAIIKNRSIQEIIKAFSKVEIPNSKLLLVGYYDDDFKIKLDEIINDCNISNVIFTGKVDNNILKGYMSLSDVTFALYDNNCLNNRLNSPNKLFDSMNCNVSLITTRTPLSRYLNDYSNFILIEDHSVTSVTLALTEATKLKLEKDNREFTLDNLFPKFVSRVFNEK